MEALLKSGAMGMYAASKGAAPLTEVRGFHLRATVGRWERGPGLKPYFSDALFRDA
jgi:hypothetical protein